VAFQVQQQVKPRELVTFMSQLLADQNSAERSAQL
jgi:hypothetical protein